MKKIILSLSLLVLIFLVIWSWQNNKMEDRDITERFIAEIYYSCDAGKQIKAKYYRGPDIPIKPGEQPITSGKVELTMNKGELIVLPQTISASGIRYATSNESIVFWSKGQNAFITENNIETYSNCTERIWTLGNKQVDEAVTDFLLSRPELAWKTATDGRNFCIFQNLFPEKELFPHYLWVRCSEYRMENKQLKELSGVSVPVKVDYPNELSYYDLKRFSISIPRDGSLYDEDVKTIFPQEIQDRLHFESRPLNEKIKQKALNSISS